MAFGSILLILAFLLFVVLFVARPLVEGEQLGAGLDQERSHWIAERERALDALLELDFDQQLGKVPPEIYAEQRQALMRQGAEALKELDQLDERPEVEQVEAALKQRRRSGPSDADLETLIAQRKKRTG